ncbi:hypothetical protein RKD55_004685 [Rossellomorea marisflavi]
MDHMTQHFAMLTATRRLESHLSRESYNLNRMAENDRIPHSLFEKKVDQHNDLIDTLNDLFASLTESPDSKLFSHFLIDPKEEVVFTIVNPVEEDVVEEEPVVDYVPVESDQPETETKEVEEDTDEPTVPIWESEGYESYEAWLQDKEAEFTQDDLSLSVNDAMSRYRAQQALNEYSETSERDIATYLPEDDSPVNVLPSSEEEGEDSPEPIPATDYTYLDHTVDNVRVDSDPTQIAAVETAVERYGENARRGTDIDVSSFLYQSAGSVVDDLINEDIEQLHSPQLVSEESVE